MVDISFQAKPAYVQNGWNLFRRLRMVPEYSKKGKGRMRNRVEEIQWAFQKGPAALPSLRSGWSQLPPRRWNEDMELKLMWEVIAWESNSETWRRRALNIGGQVEGPRTREQSLVDDM